MPANSFFPEGWNHAAPSFVVAVAHHPDGFDFAQVHRDKDGHAFEVWFAGLGETFNNAAQTVHYLRFLSRHVSGLG